MALVQSEAKSKLNSEIHELSSTRRVAVIDIILVAIDNYFSILQEISLWIKPF